MRITKRWFATEIPLVHSSVVCCTEQREVSGEDEKISEIKEENNDDYSSTGK